MSQNAQGHECLHPHARPDLVQKRKADRAVSELEAYAPLWGSGILSELEHILARLDAKRSRTGSKKRRRHLSNQIKQEFAGAEVNAPEGSRLLRAARSRQWTRR